MSPAVASLLKSYAATVLPGPVRRKYPEMAASLQLWLKRWWVRELNHRERETFRRAAERGDPLPDRLKALARDAGLIVEWPIPPRVQAKPRRRGKPNSYRSKHTVRRR